MNKKIKESEIEKRLIDMVQHADQSHLLAIYNEYWLVDLTKFDVDWDLSESNDE